MEFRPDQESRLPAIALLLATALWGSSFVVMKYALLLLHPMLVIFGRMLVATACFLPFLRKLHSRPISRGELAIILAMGLCEPCLYFLLEAAALTRTTASQASVITAMLPPLVAVSAALLLGEKLNRRLTVGFVLAATGALWLSLTADAAANAPAPALGNFLEFLAMVSATGYIILLKILSRSFSPLFLTASQAVIGTLFFFPLIFLPGVSWPDSLSWGGLAAVLYLGLAVTMGAYGLYNYGVSKVPASRAAVCINLIPVFAILLGWLLLGERLNGWQVLACFLVFGGVLYSQTREKSGNASTS